ncbi:hypothetical protein A1O1_02993 [Capronia coronata CBS 617.96]|uniref:Uncharacterized protein n=1 Tax=Capronia coronata CBS 617.96 TaxID=1182541 RepID=W9YNT4_9EURO|nr:uncharacterized protein A1O1_02993 [Capronia coronata CBS 617.96]EXJ94597.1 hypothetical protein A1O1_02993 [Capronia coronata CBS 617.96]
MTGIETAGVVLAILPLVGIETLKGFRTKRYRRRLEQYSTQLGTQHVILLNTLDQALEGIVDYEHEVAELIENPRGPLWRDPVFQKKLANKLDRNYDAFIRTMIELSASLEDLGKKNSVLRLEILQSFSWFSVQRDVDLLTTCRQIYWNDASVVEREIKKLKDVLSQSVYANLLRDIEKANTALRTLFEQSRQLQESRRKHPVSKKPLLKHKAARRHAMNLYNAVVRGKYWKCPCRDSHCVHLRIEPLALDTDEDHEAKPAMSKLRIAFSSKTPTAGNVAAWQWHEVETIPMMTDTRAVTTHSLPSSLSITPQTTAAGKVRFAIVMPSLNSLPWPKLENLPPSLPISDICSTLVKAKMD